ncbi:MAG TPA: hypothetical protein QF762_03260 [Acidimicrobiales bacterium]|jgi:GMP synthase (glutamine-hydrolysing)|nr:hypothetical protein [Acidimicrobiales bacterium]|tara:strand:+ start:487 stop:1203 length:717 start_codon:yes stop_codon:yes gene_type:complete
MSSKTFGLLLNDEIDGSLYKNYGGYQKKFSNLLTADEEAVRISVYDVMKGQLPKDPFEQQGWLVGGSRSSITALEPWMFDLFDFLRELDINKVPTVGICFGHQALAHTLGGEVKRRDVWGLGAQPINIHCVKPWMIPQLSSPIISFCHEDEVTKLPEGGKLVGGNESCEIAMFTKGDHIFSMQPHPEFSNEFTRDLYCEWSHLFDDSSLETANNSLESPSDRLIIAAWIREFFSYPRA